MAKNKKFSRYNNLIRYFKKTLPFDREVIIRRVKVPENIDGDTRILNGKFLIRINRELSEILAIECAIHEFGHVISFHLPGDHHGPHWGKAYSLVYREYLNWYEINNELFPLY